MKARLTTMAVASALTLFASADALAAPPWVDRRDTLYAGWWAFDFGLGIGHAPGPDRNAAGINMEMAVGLTDRVELGVRGGLRMTDNRDIEPDSYYGRLFDRQYFDGGNGVLANPEVRVRGAVVRGDVAELALEGRFIVPVDPNTVAGAEFGMPLALHLGDRVRLDTGFWLPTVFSNPGPILGISVPLDVWIQVTPRLWLGPMTGLYWPDVNRNPVPGNQPYVSMGFGLGYSITHWLDFKSMFLFPALNEDSRFFGVGAGVQIRIE
jgi:hypothetical protein